MKDKCAIVGVGETEFSSNSGRSELTLACEAIKAAVEDSGLRMKDIDGIVKYSFDSCPETALSQSLGIENLGFFGEIGYGGGAGCATVAHAVLAVAGGMAKYVVCYRALNERSGHRYGRPTPPAAVPGDVAFTVPYGLISPAQQVALVARRHMHEYGTTTRQFGAIAVACRKHACMNPRAQMYGKPITLEDHQNSRIVADPLRVLDCCLENDGAAAVVVTSAERAKSLRHRPVYLMAVAQASGRPGVPMVNYNRPSLTESEACYAARDLYRMAGVSPQDIDVAEIYDHFTPLVLMAIEDYGFCKKGEGGPFVEGGRIELGGELPLNTHGGNLSDAYIHGMTHIIEGVRQLRGTSTAQVKDAELALVTSGNAIPTSALILRRGDPT
ncbi:MAG: lipid-transfer protein [Chloroflexi bacterium]|nr:lipid-transfer protein [Chloroflexota bacterium]